MDRQVLIVSLDTVRDDEMPTTPSAEEEYLQSIEPNPLDCLTAKQRFVFELRNGYLDGHFYSYREIAKVMGVTHRAIQKHDLAAKRKLEKVARAGIQKA